MAQRLAVATVRAELEALGQRRGDHAQTGHELMGEVEEALRRAYGLVTISEAARLLGLHRTTVYRVYHPHD